MLGIGVVGGSDLDNVGSNEIDAFKITEDSAQLTGRPASSLWGAGYRGDYFVVLVLKFGNGRRLCSYKLDEGCQCRGRGRRGW